MFKISNCFLPVAPPSPPTPKVSDWTKSTVDLHWIPPLKDGGSKILGYWVEYKEEGTEAWVKVTGNASHEPFLWSYILKIWS